MKEEKPSGNLSMLRNELERRLTVMRYSKVSTNPPPPALPGPSTPQIQRNSLFTPPSSTQLSNPTLVAINSLFKQTNHNGTVTRYFPPP